MRLTYQSGEITFLNNAFVEDLTALNDFELVNPSATSFSLRASNGYVTTFTGSGFTFGNDQLPTGGVATEISIRQGPSGPPDVFSDIEWNPVDFLDAMVQIYVNLNTSAFHALAAQSGTITIDGSNAEDREPFATSLLFNFPSNFTAPVNFTGTSNSDIAPLSPGNDIINGLEGLDTVIYYASYYDFDIAASQDGFRISGPGQGTDRIANVEFFEFAEGIRTNLNLLDPTGDIVTGTVGDETLGGGAWNDTLSGGLGNDTLFGRTGYDVLDGNAGNDILRGEDGNDTLRGGRGEDFLDGGTGRDVLRGQREADYLQGGTGNDNLKGGGGNDTLDGGEDDDFLKGGTRRDEIIGGLGNDKLIGNSFNDTLEGGQGDDRLIAGGDDDQLNGGTGNDTLRGGEGQDVFIFESSFGRDLIEDFDVAEDTLMISRFVINTQDPEEVVALARAVGSSVKNIEIDFGDGNVIVLDRFDSTDGLADAISLSFF